MADASTTATSGAPSGISRLDRLIRLLDEGSTAHVRTTAAQQLGAICKQYPADAHAILEAVLFHLRSVKWDTRIAAAQAAHHVARSLASLASSSSCLYTTITLPQYTDDLVQFDLMSLLDDHDPLLASSGEEFHIASSNAPANIIAQKHDLKKQLGFGGEFVDDSDLLADDDLNAQPRELSAREKARLKRQEKKKAKTAAIVNNSIAGEQSNDAPGVMTVKAKTGPGNRVPLRSVQKLSSYDMKIAATQTIFLNDVIKTEMDVFVKEEVDSSGTLTLTTTSSDFDDFLEWPLQPLCDQIVNDLFNPSWEIRHGAAIALRDIIKAQGNKFGVPPNFCIAQNSPGTVATAMQHLNENRQAYLASIALKIIQVLALDRFTDFVGDQSVAPVRESCAQVLGLLGQELDEDILTGRVLCALFQLCSCADTGDQTAQWAVRFSGFIGIKYLLAVRHQAVSKSSKILNELKTILISGLEDFNDDIKAMAAASLLALNDDALRTLFEKEFESITVLLMKNLEDVDDLSSSSGFIIQLISRIIHLSPPATGLRDDQIKKLFPFIRHTLQSVRVSVLEAFKGLIPFFRLEAEKALSQNSFPAVIVTLTEVISLIFPNFIMEDHFSCLDLTKETWIALWNLYGDIFSMEFSKKQSSDTWVYISTWIVQNGFFDRWMEILTYPIGQKMSKNFINFKYDISVIDLAMLDQDLTVVDKGSIKQGRIVGAEAVAHMVSVLVLTTIHHNSAFFQNISTNFSTLFDMRGSKFQNKDTNPSTFSIQIWGIALQFWIDACTEKLQSLSKNTDYLTLEECLRFMEPSSELSTEHLAEFRKLCESLSALVNKHLTVFSDNPANCESFYEVFTSLTIMRLQVMKLLHVFHADCGIDRSVIPTLPDVNAGFTLAHVETVVTSWIPTLQSHLPQIFESRAAARTNAAEKKKELAWQKEISGLIVNMHADLRQVHITESQKISAVHGNLCSAFASVLVSLGTAIPGSTLPANANDKPRLNPVIKSLMQGLKSESNPMLRQRTARQIAKFIGSLCFEKSETCSKVASKLMKNICSLIFNDTKEVLNIELCGRMECLTFDLKPEEHASNDIDQDSVPPNEVETVTARINAEYFLQALTKMLGKRFFIDLPSFQESVMSPLTQPFSMFANNIPILKLLQNPNDEKVILQQVGKYIDENVAEGGQPIVQALHLIKTIVNDLDQDLFQQDILETLSGYVLEYIRVPNAVIRNAASQVFAAICQSFILREYKLVPSPLAMFISYALPYSSDATSEVNRRGILECIYHLITTLNTAILPYLVFLLAPILGRMSDFDMVVRKLSTTSFAMMMKLLPLEASTPNSPDLSQEMVEKKMSERRFISQLLDPKTLEPFEVPVKVNAELRKYQQDGVNWLAFLNKYSLHGILCDDMGLGKTLQTICILASDHHLRKTKFETSQAPDSKPIPSLVVCPTTLTGHWYYEIKRYVETLSPLRYYGAPAERKRLALSFSDFDVVVVSYDVLRNDIDVFKAFHFNYCILDEGHIIKNAKSKMTLAVKSVQANHRLILSGTPIQNNVLELWSLFDFLMPGFLGNEKQFSERYSKPILAMRGLKKPKGKEKASTVAKSNEAGTLALEALHKQVLPFLLRRLKEDVLNDLPPKIIQDLYCDMSPLQKRLYDSFVKSQASTVGESGQHVFQALQFMRKLCNHPALVFNSSHPEYQSIISHLKADGITNLNDIRLAPKLVSLQELLLDCGIGAPSLSNNGGGEELDVVVSPHRALIFCQLKTMLDIIENELFKKYMPTVSYLRLDGSVEASKRHDVVTKFNEDPTYDVLLMTTSVGGLGLNLTSADTVIFVEHSWNPMQDMQAMDRAHRLGQKRVVNVYRLITKNTLEEKIMGLQRFKLNIANTVVNEENAGGAFGHMEPEEILHLFEADDEPGQKRGAGPSDVNRGKKSRLDVMGMPGGSKAAALIQELDALSAQSEQQYGDEFDMNNYLSSLK